MIVVYGIIVLAAGLLIAAYVVGRRAERRSWRPWWELIEWASAGDRQLDAALTTKTIVTWLLVGVALDIALHFLNGIALHFLNGIAWPP